MPKEGRLCGGAREIMTFFSFFWRSTSLRATLQRPLPREVVISNSKTSCGPRHDCQHAMWPPETHKFDTPVLHGQLHRSLLQCLAKRSDKISIFDSNILTLFFSVLLLRIVSFQSLAPNLTVYCFRSVARVVAFVIFAIF